MTRTITFGSAHNPTKLNVDRYPNICGICHKNVDPSFIGSNLQNVTVIPEKIEAAFKCTNVDCNSIIIGYYERKDHKSNYVLIDSAPISPIEKEFNKEITKVSPNFVVIYNQSYYAEQSNLKLISGIGYRKALEYLVKDYLIFLNPENKQEIINRPLGQCINMIENESIKEISKRAAWIGNDEAHYVRKWADKDVEDLKKLIEITVFYISMDVATKDYLKEMS